MRISRYLRRLTWRVVLWGLLVLMGVNLIAAPWATSLFKSSSASAAGFSVRRLELIAALDGRSFSEGRLVGFPYPSRGTSWKQSGLKTRILRALRERANDPNANRLGDGALVRAATGHWESAVTLLEEAVAIQPRNWVLRNDLAVAYLSRAQTRNEPHDIILGLSEICIALSIAPDRPEPLYNYALILERLFLFSESKAAWARFINRNLSSAWLPEAQRHYNSLIGHVRRQKVNSSFTLDLEKALASKDNKAVYRWVRLDPQAARIYVEEVLLPHWGDAELRKDNVQALRWLDMSTTIAQALERQVGDSLLNDAVKRLAKGGGEGRENFAKALVDYREGISKYKARDISAAKHAFSRSLGRLADNPFAGWAEFHIAACSYFDRNYSDALSRATQLQDNTESKAYLSLHGRTQWLLGLIHLEQADPGLALASFRSALGKFDKSKEAANQASILSLTAHAYESMGDVRQAWRFRYAGLKVSDNARDKGRLPVILAEAVRAAMKEDKFRVALAFQNEALDLDRKSSDPLVVAEAFWRRARILQKAGNQETALYDLAIARKYCDKIKHYATRRHTEAGILATEGAVLRTTNPRKALRLLEQALSSYKNAGFEYLTGEILLNKALSYKSLGEIDRARIDLERVLSLFEKGRVNIEARDLRVSYFDQVRRALEELVLLSVEEGGEPESTLQIFERVRARCLMEDLYRRGSVACIEGRPALILGPQPRVANSWECLPSEVAVVEYMVLQDQLLVWVITSSGVSFSRLPMMESTLGYRMQAFLDSLHNQLDSSGRLAGSLYSDLIEPVLSLLPSSIKVLVFIPDGPLYVLPFAALKDSYGSFLVEKFRVSTAPSLGVYMGALAGMRERLPSYGSPSALIVGNPQIDRDKFPHLSNLPGAEAEAEMIAGIFPGSLVLLSEEATIERFRDELIGHEIVHFSGHSSVFMPDDLASGQLLFAATKHKSGELTAADLNMLPLDSTLLFVLSACHTSTGVYSVLEGVENIATPILGKGVPAVLVTSWNIQDQISSSFFKRFYYYLKTDWNPSEALRKSQLEFLRDQDPELHHPSSWAAFQLIGASY